MFTVERDESLRPMKLKIAGIIDESVNFEESMGPIGTSVQIHCEDVRRINSMGISLWSQYFNKLRAAGTSLHFYAISSALVSILNHFEGFINKSEIESLNVPFLCTKCEHQFTKLFSKVELEASKGHIQNVPCPVCGAESEFDDIKELFFSFLD